MHFNSKVLKQDTETTPHHSATRDTETPPNSASTSGSSKATTSSTLFPGAFSHHTRLTAAQVKDVVSAYQHLTKGMNSCLPAATETKPSYATTKLLNFALQKLDYIVNKRW